MEEEWQKKGGFTKTNFCLTCYAPLECTEKIPWDMCSYFCQYFENIIAWFLGFHSSVENLPRILILSLKEICLFPLAVLEISPYLGLLAFFWTLISQA